VLHIKLQVVIKCRAQSTTFWPAGHPSRSALQLLTASCWAVNGAKQCVLECVWAPTYRYVLLSALLCGDGHGVEPGVAALRPSQVHLPGCQDSCTAVHR
jgi:hypothetical protein